MYIDAKKIIDISIGIALLAGIIYLAPSVDAHSPQSMSLDYDSEMSNLTVNITHVVANPTIHYIEKVEVFLNDLLFLTKDYDSQPTNDVVGYYYFIEGEPGDVINVISYCNVGGQAEDSYEIPNGGVADETPPQLSITSPKEGDTFREADIEVRGTAGDDKEVATVEARLNGGDWTACEGEENWRIDMSLSEGDNLIEARCTDAAGNTAIAGINVSLDNDDGQPAGDDDTESVNGNEEEDSSEKSPGFAMQIFITAIISVIIALEWKRRI